MSESQNTLVIHGQYIKDLSFENPAAPASFNIQKEPEFSVSVDVEVKTASDSVYEVTLRTRVKSTADSEALFLVELEYAGMFGISAENDAILEQMLLVECPTILFPFVRRIVSDVVRDGGYHPLSLHPINFMDLYLQKINHDAANGNNLN